MSFSGWVIMILSVSFVVLLTVFCYYRVLTLPPIERDEQR